jgi:hypothetical protein
VPEGGQKFLKIVMENLIPFATFAHSQTEKDVPAEATNGKGRDNP